MKLRGWAKKFWIETTFLVVGLTLVHIVAFGPAAFRETTDIGQQSAGLFGDFVGGYFGTIFALCSAALLLATLRNQIESTQRLGFETKFFELLRQHRENALEIQINNKQGRAAFIELWDEYRQGYHHFQHAFIPGEEKSQIFVAAYYLIFYGFKNFNGQGINPCFSTISEKIMSCTFVLQQELAVELNNEKINRRFEGHHSSLGHYYRHLYQVIKYIDTQKFLTEEEKYGYAKILRAQLSNYEQALLLVNSLTPIGQSWIKNGYLKKYRFVKNIPRGFFEPYNEHLLAGFDTGYFEWEAHDDRSTS